MRKVKAIDIQLALDYCECRGLDHGKFLGCLARKLNSILAGEESKKPAPRNILTIVGNLDAAPLCKT